MYHFHPVLRKDSVVARFWQGLSAISTKHNALWLLMYSGAKKIINWIHKMKLIGGSGEGREEVWCLVLFFFLFLFFSYFIGLWNTEIYIFRHNFKLDKFYCSVIENIRIKSLIFGNRFKSWGIGDYQYTLHVNCLDPVCLKRNYILCKHNNSRTYLITDLREAIVFLCFYCGAWILRLC